MEMYQRILESINLLVQNSKEIQDEFSNNSDSYISLRYVMEHCTVKVCSARRSGHTTAINHFILDKAVGLNQKWAIVYPNQHTLEINKQNISEYFESPARLLNKNLKIIFDSKEFNNYGNKQNISEYFKSLNKNLKIIFDPKEFNDYGIIFKNGGEIQFVTINSLDRLRGTTLDGIIVDCSSLFGEKKIDMIYDYGINCMKTNKYKFFIFVE